MSTSGILVTAVSIAVLMGVGIVFMGIAWIAQRQFGWPAVLLIWLIASVLAGGLEYRDKCCDTDGGYRGHYHLIHTLPLFLGICAIAFGAVSLVVLRRGRARTTRLPGVVDLTLGALAIVVGFAMGIWVIDGHF